MTEQKIRPSDVEEFVRRYERGDKLIDIAGDADVVPSTVFYHLRKRGVPFRNKGGRLRTRSICSQALKTEMNVRGLTGTSLAAMLGYTASYVLDVVAGDKRMSKRFARRLSQILPVDFDTVLKDAENAWREKHD